MSGTHEPLDDEIVNPTDNRYFGDVMAVVASRRRVLQGGAAGAAMFFLGSAFEGSIAGAAETGGNGVSSVLNFDAIDSSTADTITAPPGHTVQTIMKWGDPINGKAPRFMTDASNPAEHQNRQFGMGHDGMWFFPLGPNRDSNTRGVMCINHEYTDVQFLFPDGDANWNAPKTMKEQNAHGVTVCEVVKKGDGSWQVVPSFRSRRITPNTKMTFSGPAAGHRLLQTNKDSFGMTPTGTVNNCGNGYTPWGTYITCEENFNGYFWEETGGTAPAITEEQAEINARYGVSRRGFGYQWASTDRTWRADLDPNRPNTFGWIVEIDPYGLSRPVKRTAMGRVKHEGAAFTTAPSGQIVVYMGDDQRFDYIYKYVSTNPWADDIAAGRSPLDDGTLYVARFDDDGTGVWLPLVHGEGPLTEENGFADQGDVLVKTRLAADLLGATPMDRPEWTTTNEDTGDAFCTLTNNTRRTADQTDAPNPRGPNRWGSIIRWNDGPTKTATTFVWDLFVLAGPGDGVDGSTVAAASNFGSPDGLWIDPRGVMWIQTDGSQPDVGNNQMLAADPMTGEIRRFAVGPVDCEVTGVSATPDGTSLFFNIQHPGDDGTAEEPTLTSTWPDGDPSGRPRPATVVIQRMDGGPVGTA